MKRRSLFSLIAGAFAGRKAAAVEPADLDDSDWDEDDYYSYELPASTSGDTIVVGETTYTFREGEFKEHGPKEKLHDAYAAAFSRAWRENVQKQ